MLRITLRSEEGWDEINECFTPSIEVPIEMEHSLISISKWEAIYKRPWLSETDNKTYDEIIDYYRCMTITKNVNPSLYSFITQQQHEIIRKYIEDPMSAGRLRESNKKSSNKKQVMTSEYIYYIMFSNGIPIDCEKWHFNRLQKLLGIFSSENEPKKKQSNKDIMDRVEAINSANRKRFGHI